MAQIDASVLNVGRWQWVIDLLFGFGIIVPLSLFVVGVVGDVGVHVAIGVSFGYVLHVTQKMWRFSELLESAVRSEAVVQVDERAGERVREEVEEVVPERAGEVVEETADRVVDEMADERVSEKVDEVVPERAEEVVGELSGEGE